MRLVIPLFLVFYSAYIYGQSHAYSIDEAHYDPTGKYIITVSSHGERIKFWESATGKLLKTIKTNDHYYGLTFSHDGKLAIISSLYEKPVIKFPSLNKTDLATFLGVEYASLSNGYKIRHVFGFSDHDQEIYFLAKTQNYRKADYFALGSIQLDDPKNPVWFTEPVKLKDDDELKIMNYFEDSKRIWVYYGANKPKYLLYEVGQEEPIVTYKADKFYDEFGLITHTTRDGKAFQGSFQRNLYSFEKKPQLVREMEGELSFFLGKNDTVYVNDYTDQLKYKRMEDGKTIGTVQLDQRLGIQDINLNLGTWLCVTNSGETANTLQVRDLKTGKVIYELYDDDKHLNKRDSTYQANRAAHRAYMAANYRNVVPDRFNYISEQNGIKFYGHIKTVKSGGKKEMVTVAVENTTGDTKTIRFNIHIQARGKELINPVYLELEPGQIYYGAKTYSYINAKRWQISKVYISGMQ